MICTNDYYTFCACSMLHVSIAINKHRAQSTHHWSTAYKMLSATTILYHWTIEHWKTIKTSYLFITRFLWNWSDLIGQCCTSICIGRFNWWVSRKRWTQPKPNCRAKLIENRKSKQFLFLFRINGVNLMANWHHRQCRLPSTISLFIVCHFCTVQFINIFHWRTRIHMRFFKSYQLYQPITRFKFIFSQLIIIHFIVYYVFVTEVSEWVRDTHQNG